jgi:hypothetical protein
MKKGLKWEESEIEQLFSMIRIIKEDDNVAQPDWSSVGSEQSDTPAHCNAVDAPGCIES